MQENQNFEKNACQNTVAMETSNRLGQDVSYQFVARKSSGKVAKFGGICFNIKKKVIIVRYSGADPVYDLVLLTD